ncbi:LysE family transporter [Pseudomonas syringae pv. aptata]|nr:LysE family transporter [Pseudomonas syringae]MCK0544977.1 LysE family transporter [Pseudomonas syringae pv. aptata]
MLRVLSRAVSLGFARSIPAMIGCLVAVVAVLSISAAGLGALLAASPRAFEALRYLGVAYLSGWATRHGAVQRNHHKTHLCRAQRCRAGACSSTDSL